jgi:phospho-N-acetylmuramoyl-pentapeptide-transferase
MGTPTMGGTVILIGISSRTSRRGSCSRASRRRASCCWRAAFGLGLIGFVDDYIKVRQRRSLGLSKVGKTIGQALVAAAFGILAVHYRARPPRTCRSCARRAPRPRIFFYVWVFVMLSAASTA